MFHIIANIKRYTEISKANERFIFIFTKYLIKLIYYKSNNILMIIIL